MLMGGEASLEQETRGQWSQSVVPGPAAQWAGKGWVDRGRFMKVGKGSGGLFPFHSFVSSLFFFFCVPGFWKWLLPVISLGAMGKVVMKL